MGRLLQQPDGAQGPGRAPALGCGRISGCNCILNSLRATFYSASSAAPPLLSMFAPGPKSAQHLGQSIRVIPLTLHATLLQADPSCGTPTDSDYTGETVVQTTKPVSTSLAPVRKLQFKLPVMCASLPTPSTVPHCRLLKSVVPSHVVTSSVCPCRRTGPDADPTQLECRRGA